MRQGRRRLHRHQRLAQAAGAGRMADGRAGRDFGYGARQARGAVDRPGESGRAERGPGRREGRQGVSSRQLLRRNRIHGH